MARTKTIKSENEPVISVQETIEMLQKQLELVQKQLDMQVSNAKEPEQKDKFDINRIVTVVHLLDNIEGLTTHLKVDDTHSYDLRKFGDTIRLRYMDFEALYYANKMAFEQNIIGITSADEDIVELLGLKTTTDDLPINSALLRDFPNMTEEEMEKFYNKLSSIHKQLVIRKWYAGYEDKDANGNLKNKVFADKRKIRFLNDLTSGQMERLLEQIAYQEEIKK